MTDCSDFEVILLAAGLSSRMGRANKLLTRIDGQPLVRRTAQLYCDMGMEVTVITGHQATEVEAVLEGLPLRVHRNPDFAEGQKSSVRFGLDHVTLEKSGLLIALSDQPLLSHKDIAGFCKAFLASDRRKVFVPEFSGNPGNPILFPSLMARKITDDGKVPGCRKFIQNHPELVCNFKVENNHFSFDLDTPTDLETFARLTITTGRQDGNQRQQPH